jgi:phosphoglycolate phosphatase
VKVLDALGLSARFFAIIGGDTLGPGRAKPAPDLLDEMVARAGGGRAAFVGDTTFDTLAAKAAGLPCVAVSFGYNDRPMAELGADATIDHFDALIHALLELDTGRG